MNNLDFKKIKISTLGSGKPFIKQLPNLEPIWEDCHFYINENIDRCDLWVIYGGLNNTEKVIVPKGRTIFITTEPSTVKKYGKKFLNQFDVIITSQSCIKHKNVILNQQALPWWLGYKINSDQNKIEKSYDELSNTDLPQKTISASMIVSNKNFTKDHRRRINFLKKIKELLPNEIDIFGIGYNPINDKWDAIAPYKYHVVIENTSCNDFFTEKLSDAFLGGSYPIYHGCKNIFKYFPKGSMTTIDINRPMKAIKKIRSVINSKEYENNLNLIRKSKDLILNKYQIFPMLCDYFNNLEKQEMTEEKIIEPEKDNRILFLLRKIKRKIIK